MVDSHAGQAALTDIHLLPAGGDRYDSPRDRCDPGLPKADEARFSPEGRLS
jgi:hypothetical protein